MRHSALVRITHWINALSFGALVVSGFAILLAHPRLYWGETGAVGAPSLIDLPLPFVLTGQSGWGRYLHFLSAWITILTGILYVTAGIRTHHFRRDLLQQDAGDAWQSYGGLQRLAYLTVVFILFPLMIWTGFAMSPALTSVMPALVTLLGGQQSARTIHFAVANLLVLFLVGHVAMVWLTGFSTKMRAMILGEGSSHRLPQT